MTVREANAGERRARARKLRKNLIVAALLAIGMATGIAVGSGLGPDYGKLIDSSTDMDPALALGIVAVWLGASLVGSLLYRRTTDEVERAGLYKAYAAAGSVYFIGYPVWFFLWKGGLAPEPSHGLIFLAFWFILMSGTLAARFR